MLKAFTDKRLQTYKPTEKKQRISDPATKGLYFIVEALPNGTKSFAYRYKFDGQSKQLSLGKYPVLSLADARLKVLELQRLIADGVDPKQIRQERKQEQEKTRILEQTKQVTFKQAFDDYCRFKTTPVHESGSASWTYQTMKKHIERVNNYVMPTLGERSVVELTERDLEVVLLNVQEHGTLANRDKLKSLFKGLFDWVRYHVRDPITDAPIMQHNIALLIAKAPFIKHQSNNYKHVTTAKELKVVVQQVDEMPGTIEVKTAVQLALLLAMRPSNIVNMRWSQIDFNDKTVAYTEQDMKMRKGFISPLSNQAIQLLENLQPLTGYSDFVFLSPYGGAGKPISRDSLNNALRRSGIEINAHGLRHSFSTLANELGYDADLIEAQLAHTLSGVRGIYNKAQHLQKRSAMMQDWADYLDTLRGTRK